jgi:hypothetical protein
MRRTDLPPHKSATYVLPRWKTVYVSVPKAACTSLKWLVADLQGEDAQHFYRALSRETGRQMTIHHRSRWQHTPMLTELSDGELEQISPENGWFVFAVVRHPTARLWSGWQSKFLLQEPRFQDLYPDSPWPRLPRSTQDVVDDFHEFVASMTTEARPAVLDDRHFRGQHGLLRPESVPYTRVYRTAEMGDLLRDLEDHVRPLGLSALPQLRRSNETPLLPVKSLFSDEVLDVVRRHYADDFETFGYDDPMPGGLAPSDEYSSEQLAEVGRLVERGERIGDLYRIAREARAKEQATRVRLRALRRKQARQSPSPALLRRVRGRAARVVRRVSGR